jgi:YL1 nuclear protein C-terminal domain
MSAMFGDHVRWDELKVFTGKGRPLGTSYAHVLVYSCLPFSTLARPVRTCPITGQAEKYCDPRTNVPFANVGAYDALTKVLVRGYVWCSALGCYVGVSNTSRREGAPSGSGEGRAGSSVGSKTMGDAAADIGEDDSRAETEELEERTTKRRKVGITDG